MRYIPFTIQKQNPDTYEWDDLWTLHALKVNKSGGDKVHTAGAEQYKATLSFEVRHFKALEELRYTPQSYRIVYRGHFFNLVDYDDFMEQHSTVRLVGEAYG